jgi:hypothetical protein
VVFIKLGSALSQSPEIELGSSGIKSGELGIVEAGNERVLDSVDMSEYFNKIETLRSLGVTSNNPSSWPTTYKYGYTVLVTDKDKATSAKPSPTLKLGKQLAPLIGGVVVVVVVVVLVGIPSHGLYRLVVTLNEPVFVEKLSGTSLNANQIVPKSPPSSVGDL